MKNKFLIIFVCLGLIVKAQNQTIIANERELDPLQAAVYSAVLPGMGQIYNGSWLSWLKVPLIYACIITSVGFTLYYNDKYHSFRKAYLIRKEGGKDEFHDIYLRESSLLYAQELYQKQQYHALFFSIGFYLLNIIDAYVTVHLHYFNISEDLRVTPTVMIDDMGWDNIPVLGLSVSYNL